MESQGMDSGRGDPGRGDLGRGRAFGGYLRSERRLRKIPLEEIAIATKIPVRSLELLEEGQWSDLPAEVFVRGFVRSYVRHLDLDEAEAFRRYREAVEPNRRAAIPTPAEVEDLTEERAEEPSGELIPGRRRFELAIFVIIVLILATITMSLLWQGGNNTDIQARVDPPATPSATGNGNTERPV